MKKLFLSLAAIAAFFATSCVKEEAGNDTKQELKLVPYSFTTGIDETEDTKAGILDPEARTLTWNAGDEVKIFDGVANNLKYTTDLTADATRATFCGMITEGQSPLCALYPYQENAYYADGKITASIPAEQIARERNFPREAAVATGTPTAEDKVTFYFIGSFIKFTLPEGISDGKTIESMTFSGNDNEPLTGKFTSEPNADGNGGRKTAVPVTGETSPTVTLTGDIQEGKEYLASVFQCKLSKGYTLSVLFSDGTRKYIRTTTTLKQTSRGGVLKLLKGAAANNFKSTMPNDLFIAWIHGYDLVNAGGVEINVKNYPWAVKMLSVNELGVLEPNTIYFMEKDFLLNTNPSRNIISSRYADTKIKMTRDAWLRLVPANDGAVLVFKNLNYEYTATTGYQIAVSADGLTNLVAFDGCTFNMAATQLLQGGDSRPIQSVVYSNCNIALQPVEVTSSYGLCYTKGNYTMDKVVFENNIIYCPDGGRTNVYGLNNKSLSVNDFIVKHNTFVNYYMNYDQAFVYVKEINNAECSNNLHYFDNYITDYKYNSYFRVANDNASVYKLVSNGGTLTAVHNYAIYNAEIVPTVKMKVGYASTAEGEMFSKTTAEQDVFNLNDPAKFDIAKGIFVSNNKEYGATR